MRVFSIAGAQHYCQHFHGVAAPQSGSLEDFVRGQRARSRNFTEGSTAFDAYRTLALRNVERDLFLAASHFRRSLDLMIRSSSHWAHVTLYYGAFFAARSLLGMFGCRVLSDRVIDVDRSEPGTQRLEQRLINRGSNQYTLSRRGSHERFWEAFYNATRTIRPLTNPPATTVLTPISNDETWLTRQRNTVNYTAEESIDHTNEFASVFDHSNIPHRLPGVTNTQYRVCEGLIAVALDFSDRFVLGTDALDVYGAQGTLREKIKRFVYDVSVPNIVGQTYGHQLFRFVMEPPLKSLYRQT